MSFITTIKPGCHLYRLLELLSIAGEFPIISLHLLGNARVLKALIHKHEKREPLRFGAGGQVYALRLFSVSGKRGARTLRLCKPALPILEQLRPGALAYYLSAFQSHSFSGGLYHTERNHRMAEMLAMCMMAGIEFRPCALPALKKHEPQDLAFPEPAFYIARDLKRLEKGEAQKTMFTRTVGALFYSGSLHVVYNTRASAMKWMGGGEIKAKLDAELLLHMNTGAAATASALLLGRTTETALDTLVNANAKSRIEQRFDRIYQSIHYIPMDAEGVRLLKILTIPNWNERLLSELFSPEERGDGYGSFEYDAFIDGKYVFSHLDSDLARLMRFKPCHELPGHQFLILCYGWQVPFLRSYLGKSAKLQILRMDLLEKKLGLA